MPSRSETQRRKTAILHRQGKITDDEWEHFKKVVPKQRRKKKQKGHRKH